MIKYVPVYLYLFINNIIYWFYIYKTSLKNIMQDKSFLASGDNKKNVSEKFTEKPKRNIPSVRRFSNLYQKSNYQQLKDAINELSFTADNRKAIISKDIFVSQDTIRRSNNLPQEFYNIKNQRKNKKLVGRQIYEILLLYSWRKRKTYVVLLIDSLGITESYNRKLKLQIDALHSLRTAESEKRNEAIARSQLLHCEKEDIFENINNLETEKCLLQNEVKVSRDKLNITKSHFQSVKIDLISKLEDLKNYNHQLSFEISQIKRLCVQKRSLQEHVIIRTQKNQESSYKFKELHDKLFTTNFNLQNTSISNNLRQKEYEKLSRELEIEQSTNRSIKECNKKLKLYLLVFRKALQQEQNRPWWKDASDLTFAFVNIVNDILANLLPLMDSED